MYIGCGGYYTLKTGFPFIGNTNILATVKNIIATGIFIRYMFARYGTIISWIIVYTSYISIKIRASRIISKIIIRVDVQSRITKIPGARWSKVVTDINTTVGNT